jgi:hypothetical protein
VVLQALPEKGSLTLFSRERVEPLRCRHGDPMVLKCEIPIVLANNPKGAKHIFIDHARLPFFLGLRPRDVVSLRKDGLVQSEEPVKTLKQRSNTEELAEEYKQKLQSGEFATRGALARSLGVSRAWINKVMCHLADS